MEKKWQVCAIIMAVLIIIALYWTRFQVVQANYAYAPAFYKINRFSGDVTLVVGKEFVTVEKADERAPRPAAPAPAPGTAPVPAPAPGK
jgi:hypothetical protein